jgi:hypothetical protein
MGKKTSLNNKENEPGHLPPAMYNKKHSSINKSN